MSQQIAKHNPLRASLLQFIQNSSVTFNYAATLTFLRAVTDRITAEKAGRAFINRFNRKLGNKKWWKKVNKNKSAQAATLAILEGDGKYKHFHYHFALVKPDDMSNKKFEWLVKTCWQDTGNGSIYLNVVEPMYNGSEWIDYITKEIKTTNLNALVPSATHVY